MKILVKVALKLAANTAILYYLPRFLSGFSRPDDLQAILAIAALVTLIHLVLRPILKIASFPLILITFGLFNVVINLILLLIADSLSAGLAISGFGTFFAAALIFGIINSL